MKVFNHRKELETSVTLLAISLVAAFSTGCKSHSHGAGASYWSGPTYQTGSGGMASSTTGQPLYPVYTTGQASQGASESPGATTTGQGSSTASTSQSTAPASTSDQSASTQVGNNVMIPLHKETLNVGKREVDAGTVRLRKNVKTETVNQPIQLRSETVTIDRVPAPTGRTDTSSSQQTLGQPFQEQEMTIHLRREEPMVQTQVVPNGEVVAQRQIQTQQTNVQGQVRSEEIVIDKSNAQGVNISPNLKNSDAVGGSGDAGGQSSGSGSSGSSTDSPR